MKQGTNSGGWKIKSKQEIIATGNGLELQQQN